MLKVKREGIILKPTRQDFESKAVLNPAVIQEGNDVHIIYRAITKNDHFISTLGYARLNGPKKVAERWKQPFMTPLYEYEKKGVEDPRIVKIGDTYYMAYIAHDGKNALIACASGKNLFKMRKNGIIGPKINYDRASRLFRRSKLKDDYYFFESYYSEYAGNDVLIWSKDGLLFPEKIQGKFALVHRVLPDVQLALAGSLNEFKKQSFWVDHVSNLSKHVILEGRHGFEGRHVGAGCPPVKTKKGWVFIYHAAEETNRGRIYHAGLALYDLKNPKKMIARLPYPFFSPEEKFEMKGFVNHVVFPTGTAIFGDKLYIYYGAADTYIAVASVNIDEMLKELMKNKITGMHK